MTEHKTISKNLTIGNNSFGLLRLIAAIAVVFSHSWSVTGGITFMEPLHDLTSFELGWHAVNLFFALSGLLISGSLDHSRSIIRFAYSRILRIFPALFVIVVLTLVIAYAFADTSKWQFTSVFEYLLRNFFLIGASATLPGVFEHNPIPGEINIPLWTLKYEVLAYISIASLSAVCWRFPNQLNIRIVTFIILITCALTLFSFGSSQEYGKFEHAVRLTFAFYLGVAAWQWRDKIQARILYLLILSILNVGLLWFEVYNAAFEILWVAYAGLWLGTHTFGWITRKTDMQDYSYGIYIIGYPVQQMVMAYTGFADPYFNFTVSMLFILFLAFCSWNIIEKPALRLKNWNRSQGR